MGLKEWVARRLGIRDTTGDRYVLKRQGPKGGMHKVMDLAGPTPIDELYESLEPGIYALHLYKKGKSGFEVVWGSTQVTGEPVEGAITPKKQGEGSAMSEFAQFAMGLAALKEKATAEFEAIAPLFGVSVGEGGPRSFIEEYRAAKEEYNELGELFGDRTSGLEPIKYEGTVPILLHPQLIPELFDATLDKIEKRLQRWGVVSDEDESREREEDKLDAFPDRPEPESEPVEEVKEEDETIDPDEEKPEEE